MAETIAPLTTSYWPAEPSSEIRDVTLGTLLREAVEAVPDRVALVDAHPDPAQRRQ